VPSGCQSCAALGAQCGTVKNNCDQTLDCGGCPGDRPNEACAALGTANKCECRPTVCGQVTGCGDFDDGCGGTITCGCGVNASCESGACQTCFTQVGAGGTFSCALRKTDGTVWCWGRSDLGQLGDGTLGGAPCTVGGKAVACRTSPVKVADLVDAVELSVGGDHACAVTSKGELFCWGSDASGQLATKRAPVQGDNFKGPRPARIEAPGGDGAAAKAVSAGATHTCAVFGDQLYCWGDNGGGQLGVESGGPLPLSTSPLLVTFASPKLLGAGRKLTCATNAQNEGFCWGDNSHGQLGADLTNVSFKNTPARLADGPAGPLDVAAVRAGFRHACAVTAGKELFCWGDNEVRQLGNLNVTGGRSYVPVQAQGKDAKPFQSVVGAGAGEQHTCVLDEQGTVSCWGKGGRERLGRPTSDAGTDPTPQAVDGLGPVTALSVGANHACALNKLGDIYCWGVNETGAAGSTDFGTPVSSPARVLLSCSDGVAAAARASAD
jgi:alpha-tubulin suppressor-like RCC1 family protein